MAQPAIGYNLLITARIDAGPIQDTTQLLRGEEGVVLMNQLPEKGVYCAGNPSGALGAVIEIELDLSRGRTDSFAPVFLG